jgi:hypothetical protein
MRDAEKGNINIYSGWYYYILFYKVWGNSAVNDARLLIYIPSGGVGHFDFESGAHIGMGILLAWHYLIKEDNRTKY